ncbi:MAG: galactokinase [Candidatus Hydrogenedentes bacterium]|nr:galactokinase [Candidatus Hydrogenedentota bacterium]
MNPDPETHTDATWAARAPGRVNLIGEHIDYNDGWVLPMALDRAITMRAEPRADGACVFTSASQPNETVRIEPGLSTRESLPHWGRYLFGAIEVFRRETGAALPGFEARIDSTLPAGAGLSSSAALEVAAMTLLETITGCRLPPLDKALLCREVEHRYAGVPCGLMDQMASVLCRAGCFLLIDCVSHETRHIPLAHPDVVVLVTNTGVSHALADGEYAARRAQCAEALKALGATSWRGVTTEILEAARDRLGAIHYPRARHVISEIARTRAAATALESGDWPALGEAMYASHDSLANDYAVSCPELDCLVDSARRIGMDGGVIGARMTGGGFGGSTVTLVRRAQLDTVRARLEADFQHAFGRAPSSFASPPAQGSG